MSGSRSPAVELDRVSKRYSVGHRGGLFNLNRRGRHEKLWALREVNLRVEPGESVGLIGHNGAGKTTVLRLLAGITRPSAGRVFTDGRVASLINLGAGFHPELTGRENVFLNGVILGLSRREVAARFDEIVEFADLGPYIDTPLKRYSSGMYARLGFAVAAHVDPDVLLVDEVLSVGDVAFQDRSMRKMLSFRDSGQAILFVSHNLSAVEMMCQRAIWLDRGSVRLVGPTGDVVRAYLDAVDAALIEDGRSLTADRFARADGLSEGPRGPAAPLEIPQPAASEEGPATQRAASEDKQATRRTVEEEEQAIRRGFGEAGQAIQRTVEAEERPIRPAVGEAGQAIQPAVGEEEGAIQRAVGEGELAIWGSVGEAGDDDWEAVLVQEVSLYDREGRLATDFEYGDWLRIKIRCLAHLDVRQVQCVVTVRGDFGPLFSGESEIFDAWQPGVHALECVFESLPLLPGLYRVDVQLKHAGTPRWALPQSRAAFRVVTDLAAFGSKSPVGATKSRGGFLAVAYDWRVSSTAGEQVLPGLRRPLGHDPDRIYQPPAIE